MWFCKTPWLAVVLLVLCPCSVNTLVVEGGKIFRKRPSSQSTSEPGQEKTLDETASEIAVETGDSSKTLVASGRFGSFQAQRSWMMMLVGGLVSAFGVIGLWYLGNYLSSPTPYMTGTARLQVDYEEASQQVESLKVALEQAKLEEQAKKAKEERAHMDEAAESGKELVSQAQASVAAAEAQVAKTLGFTATVYETGELPKETEELLKSTISEVRKQAAPMVARAGHVYNVLEEGSNGIRDRLVGFAKDEALSLSMKLQAAVQLPEDQLPLLSKMKVPDVKEITQFFEGRTSDFDLPPISLFVAAIFAPAQLRWVMVWDQLHVCASGLCFALTVGCIVADWDQECADVLVWTWAIGYTVLCALDVALRFINMARVAAALASLEVEKMDKGGIMTTGNKIWDSFLQMQLSSESCFRAFFKYNEVAQSWAFFLSRFLGVFLIIWNCFGLCVSMFNVVQDSLHCSAHLILFWMRLRSFIYVVLLFWTLTQALLTVIVRLQVVENAIMKLAVRADEQNGDVPVFSILARSLLMQEHRVELKIREAMITEEIKVLQEEQLRHLNLSKSFEEKLTDRTALAQRIHDERVVEEAQTNQERVDKCVNLAKGMLSKAEPFVAIAAHKYEQSKRESQSGSSQQGAAAAATAEAANTAAPLAAPL